MGFASFIIYLLEIYQNLPVKIRLDFDYEVKWIVFAILHGTFPY